MGDPYDPNELLGYTPRPVALERREDKTFGTTMDAISKVVATMDLSTFPMEIKVRITQRSGPWKWGPHLHVFIKTSHLVQSAEPMWIQAETPIYPQDIHDPVAFVFQRITRLMLHELAEHFKVDGKQAYDPHAMSENRLEQISRLGDMEYLLGMARRP